VYLTRHQECRMMPRRHQTIACAKTGSCALSPFSVAYTTSISGRQRMLTELLRMTAGLGGVLGLILIVLFVLWLLGGLHING
jgi:hypothetical protein